jgi:magnesium-transporting ATPase (P-type)
MPMTAAQILWINLITTVTLGLVLAFEPSEPGVMRRPPRPAGAPLLSRFLIWRVCLVSALFGAGGLAVFFYVLERGLGVDMARTVVVNLIVVFGIFYLFNVRYLHVTSITWRGALGTPAVLLALAVVIAAQLTFTYAPFMHALFETCAVPIAEGLVIIGAGILLMLVLEGEKIILRRFGAFPAREA